MGLGPDIIRKLGGKESPKDLTEKLQPSIALVRDYNVLGREIESGSAFLINSAKGLLLTNEHVIAKGHKHSIEFPYSELDEKTLLPRSYFRRAKISDKPT